MAGQTIAFATNWGSADMIPASGDYDGDHFEDLGVFQPTTGRWFIWSMAKGRTLANGTQ